MKVSLRAVRTFNAIPRLEAIWAAAGTQALRVPHGGGAPGRVAQRHLQRDACRPELLLPLRQLGATAPSDCTERANWLSHCVARLSIAEA